MKKSLIAMAFGTFALGMAEFVMMSILPYVARSIQCNIPQAGHLISAYAIGVCAGAPDLRADRRRDRGYVPRGQADVSGRDGA